MFRFSNIPKYAIKRSQNKCKQFSSNSFKTKLSETFALKHKGETSETKVLL